MLSWCSLGNGRHPLTRKFGLRWRIQARMTFSDLWGPREVMLKNKGFLLFGSWSKFASSCLTVYCELVSWYWYNSRALALCALFVSHCMLKARSPRYVSASLTDLEPTLRYAEILYTAEGSASVFRMHFLKDAEQYYSTPLV